MLSEETGVRGGKRGGQRHAGTRRTGAQRGEIRPGDVRPGHYRDEHRARAIDERHAPVPDERRARIMAARRRMLMMLMALTGLAVALAAFRFTAWWVVAAPALLLFCYLMLLREASRMDAELRQRHALAHAAAPARASRAQPAVPARPASVPGRVAAAASRPAATAPDVPAVASGGAVAADGVTGSAARGHMAAPAPDPVADAEVVAIPPRADDDELYDQYADARLRAVGD